MRCQHVCAVVLAAGAGRRMGQDKALLDLGGTTAIERVVADLELAGVDSVVVVRAAGAGPLPAGLAERAHVVLAHGSEMIASVRAGVAARPPAADGLLLLPVDHALAGHEALAALIARLDPGHGRIVLPLHGGRPGHPIALAASLAAELDDPRVTTLRDVIRRDPGRVLAVPVASPWVVRDLDTPADLAAARAALRGPPADVLALMAAHRSRRAFAATPIEDAQLEALVDAARHASTSSMLQTYQVVAVRDAQRRAQVAALCAGQAHVREAPVFLAICADLHKLALACERHGVTLDASALELFVEATIDAALLGQNLLLAAESQGLGGCMIGAAREHPVQLARLLGLPRGCYVAFGLVLGHPADDPLPRPRLPLRAVLQRERHEAAALAGVLDEADAAARAWAQATNEQRGGFLGRRVDVTRGWSDRVARLWSHEHPQSKARRNLAAELRELGFGLQ
jgi:nitroreductase/CTP:molybdopterin cytidylyltransferase MocA